LIRPVTFALGLAALFPAPAGAAEPAPWVREFETMGTYARLEVHDEDPALHAPALAAMKAAFDSVNTVMSTWDPLSEISRLNRAPADSAITLSPWLGECLAAAEEVRDASGGAFEPTAEPLMRLWGFYRRQGRLPSRAELDSTLALLGGYEFDAARRRVTKTRAGTAFDLGGIAKGFAVDRAAESLRALGLRDALVDLGGNLFCLGGARGMRDWRVGVRDPRDRERVFARLEVSGRALATSGSYERFVTIDGRRYGHIMNPVTGRPAGDLLSATVVSESATLADALSTALFVLGPVGAMRMLAESYPDVDAVLVLPRTSAQEKARVLATRALAGRIELLAGYGEHYAIEFF